MNNSNDYSSSQVDTQIEQPVPASDPISQVPPTASKQSRSWTKVALVVVTTLAVLLLVVAAYFLGRTNGEKVAPKNSAIPETSSTSDTKPAEDLPEMTSGIADGYEGWNTYTNTAHGYSFKYPSDWQVSREVIMQEPHDWVHINPAGGKKNPSGADLLAIFTYFDGTGCPQTTTKQFTVGSYTVEGVACAEESLYKVGMKSSRTVSKGSQGVVLARAASDAVGIQINMTDGTNETLERILKSVTGLTPATN